MRHEIKINILVVPGYTRNQQKLKEVECYDPDDNTWSEVAPLLVPRTGACAITVDDTIIVIGGTNLKRPLSSCEIYDRNQNTWEYIARKYMASYIILNVLRWSIFTSPNTPPREDVRI